MVGPGKSPGPTKPASNKKKETGYIEKPHTAIFIGQTGSGTN